MGVYFLLTMPMKNVLYLNMKTKSKKPLYNFNDFWPLLKNEAKRQGIGVVLWLERSGLNYQRYSEFNKGTRDVSAKYFLKLMGGLNLKPDIIEKKLGRKMTPEQKKMLQFEAKVEANRDWIEKLLDDPDLIKITKSIIEAKKK